ncbi:hypothetical protein Q5425_04715 [Amycolatopsis sp. A133]|uniref:hypothetical protein n=1 Tax=Amycolatopsis sp. A133 TaxID=3064472 RepID=UPI0027FA22B5|nr:hypothetical protein [Amycolatopsis sp. A133]MDQ7803019.1 hypothetical protein [Amycolatopsis sp. A133]
MAANYRYWCGECSYRTPWLTESGGAATQARHYAQRHARTMPGGRVEVRAKRTEGGGCVWLVAVLFLVLLLASTCRQEARSAPAPQVCGTCAVTSAR